MDSQLKQMKIPMENVTNLQNFEKYKRLLQCSLCNYLCLSPANCEKCQGTFCRLCLEELKIDNKCPSCIEDLSLCNEQFYQFFKDLRVKCPQCKEQISYGVINTHKCLLEDKKDAILFAEEEPKLVNNIIMVKCKKCGEYVKNDIQLIHTEACLGKLSDTTVTSKFKCSHCMKDLTKDEQVLHVNECPMNKTIVLKDSPSDVRINMIELTENLTKFAMNLEKANLQQLVKALESLNSNISTFQQSMEVSFCRACKSVKKEYKLFKCKCCNKFYCMTCGIACFQCEAVLSKTCLGKCRSCNADKCPLCEINTGEYCLCLDTKFCNACLKNPTTKSLGIGLLKGPHVNCKYLRILDPGVFLMKIPNQNFKCELTMNSLKQVISLSLIVQGKEVFSKLFQININDKIILISDGVNFKLASSCDFWVIEFKNCGGTLDYLILNFNANPSYGQVLSKLHNCSFEQLGGTNIISDRMIGYGAFQQFQTILFSNIHFQKY